MSKQTLFTEWMILKESIQTIASAVQNDGVKLTGEDLLYWLSVIEKFKNDFDALQRKTWDEIQ